MAVRVPIFMAVRLGYRGNLIDPNSHKCRFQPQDAYAPTPNPSLSLWPTPYSSRPIKMPIRLCLSPLALSRCLFAYAYAYALVLNAYPDAYAPRLMVRLMITHAPR